MSNTRRSSDDGTYRPERYASSEAFEVGLPANLVAKRCAVLSDPAARELLYWLQYQSHQDGGLKAIAGRLLSAYPHDVGTVTMQAVGMRPGQRYNAATVRRVRSEIADSRVDDAFLLRGEQTLLEEMGCKAAPAAQRPESYLAADFAALCQERAATLHDYLRDACLDPATPMTPGSPWYFPSLAARLRELMAEDAKALLAAGAQTELTKSVSETLDYALDQRCMVVIEGKGRIGKTFACKRWCEARPGKARFVSVPSCSDSISFFRAIAKALGVSSALSLKGSQLRDRVEATLLCGDLMLVLDEGWALFPQRGRPREAMPSRISWIMTALVNHGLPVAICSTPQFMKSQRAYTTATHWSAEQFIGRIAHFERLPDAIPEKDLEAVARWALPELDASSIAGLVSYAAVTEKGLAGIEFTAKRARFLASKAGRTVPTKADVQLAILNSGLPSESALAKALGMRTVTTAPRQAAHKATTNLPAAQAVQHPRKAIATASADIAERAPAPVVEPANV